jgi:Ca2+-binding RTX toxin-like protein
MKKGTRRGVLLLASMLAMLVVVGGVAWAVTKVGDNGPNHINGTNGPDRLRGMGGGDTINGKRGADSIWGDRGGDLLKDGPLRERSTDYLYGGPGNDTFNTNNKPSHVDWIKCGPGFDKVVADPIDRSRNRSACEDVRTY